MVTLYHMGRIKPGEHLIETPVGDVTAILHDDLRVSVRNVSSHVLRQNIAVEVSELRTYTGDIAWGGNWFFLISDHGEELRTQNVERLTDVTWKIRQALRGQGIMGENGSEIDHIELFGPPTDQRNHSRNFVLCPGKAYDRSPCGTGTSAKLACLAAAGKLAPGEIWRQESVIGSVFEGSYQPDGPGRIIPTITGTAHVTAEAKLIFSDADPFREGIA
jgi:4-hydroxyproline epimerase